MNLFINYFDHKDRQRRKEIEYCLELNEANKHIKNIIVVNRGNRATFGEFFQLMRPYKNDVNIIANLDIWFDETIKLADTILPMTCYALTRWEQLGNKIIPFADRHGKRVPAAWSQDAWIFRGAPNPTGFDSVKAVDLNTRKNVQIPFGMGIAGCDNKLAAMLTERQYTVLNPSYSIRAVHVHKSNGREYPPYQILSGIRPYGLVHPRAL